MRLEIVRSKETQKVSPESIADYATFAKWQKPSAGVTGVQVFERFRAARSLTSQGMETFLNPWLSDLQNESTTRVDVCGVREGEITAVFCETGDPSPSLASSIATIQSSENARAIILVPSIADSRLIGEVLPATSEHGRMAVETLGWFDDRFDATFQQALRLIDILGNETRMRMLVPLFGKAGAKRDYRAKINPKLVYANLSLFVEAGLVDEFDEGTYELSELGKSILAEFITFLEKARKTLDSIQEKKEVTSL